MVLWKFVTTDIVRNIAANWLEAIVRNLHIGDEYVHC